MNNFQNELEKAQKYHSFGNQHISVYMYQTFGIIILSMIFYKYVIGYFFPDLPKDFFSAFLIVSCGAFCFYIQKQLKKQDKEQKSISFENVNLFEFLQQYVQEKSSKVPNHDAEKLSQYTSQLYLAITGSIMKDKIKYSQQTEELNNFYEQVENKTLQMKSHTILRHINALQQ